MFTFYLDLFGRFVFDVLDGHIIKSNNLDALDTIICTYFFFIILIYA